MKRLTIYYSKSPLADNFGLARECKLNICTFNLLRLLLSGGEPLDLIQIDSLMLSISYPLRILFSVRWFFLPIFLSLNNICYSQNISHNDSLEYQSQFEFFDDAIGIENTGIINGIKYTVPFQISGTHPFYNAAIGTKGNVTFMDQPYFNLTLLYDIYSDELIVQQPRATGAQALIKLYKKNVKSFRIYDHTFKNYQGQEAQKLGMVNGFYDVLHENAVFTLIAMRKKKYPGPNRGYSTIRK